MLDSGGITRPKIVAVANAAGSAGKTTSTVSLAALLAGMGRRVLVIDGDAQATASWWFGVTEPTHDVGDLLLRRAAAIDTISDTNTEGVQLIPSTAGVDSDVITLTSTRAGEQRMRLALADVDADVILIDCPGSINAITLAALVAADAVLTVTAPTLKEMGGIPQLEKVITDIAEAYNAELSLVGIIPCAVPRGAGKGYDDAMALLRETYTDLVTPAVRRTVRVMEAHGNQSPLPSHAPRDGATEDYQAVLSWLTDRGVL